MKPFVLALPLLLAAAAAARADELGLPLTMSLEDEPRERQDVENDRQRPDDTASLTPMEFFYRHSELEAGAMYTDFSSDLQLKSHMGFYVRYGVEIFPHISVHMTYRYNEFGNGPTSAPPEDIRMQALLFGAGIHVPLHPEFALVLGGGVGPTWLDSSVVRNEIGFTVTGEAAVTARLWEMLRLKVGLVIDGINTDFHQTSTNFSLNLSYLVGLEIGM
ncbi:MAG TPA: hypothetical protein VE981_08070 [Planctomycetota bacterium]|nr:hypothetical protein [Planctomycetota bacterium]